MVGTAVRGDGLYGLHLQIYQIYLAVFVSFVVTTWSGYGKHLES